MTQTTLSRSVLETPTIEFKQHFREYLKVLAQDVDSMRVELIEHLEWCFDRWEHWRQKFYPDADLMFPFFLSMKAGKEFGHYSTLGPSGQPSVIHLKRSYLMGTSDTTVWKISPTKKLVLKKDHSDRLKFVEQTILHELVHQFLHEASPQAAEYESESANYGGHGPLFAAECNRINSILHPEMGFEFVPVRHKKRSHAKVRDVQRPSCAQFTHGELFWAWDPESTDLLEWQQEENDRRLKQALAFYGGAVVVVDEAEEVETDFPAPYAVDCAEVCIQQLIAYDKANGTTLLNAFVQGVLEHAGESSAAPLNIPPAQKQVPLFVDQTGGSLERPDQPTVQVQPDSDGLTIRDVYPVTDPATSLERLNADIKAAGGKGALCKHRFGLKDGSTLSRHLKALKKEIEELVAA